MGASARRRGGSIVEAPRDIKKRPRLGSDGTIAIAASRSTRRRAHCVWRWSRTRRAVSGRCKVIFGARRHTFFSYDTNGGPRKDTRSPVLSARSCEPPRRWAIPEMASVESKEASFDRRSVLSAALQIHSVEARHASSVRLAVGKSGSEGAFDKPMPKNEVLEAGKPFFV